MLFRSVRCGKIENFLSLRKRNRLPQPHASNADRLNEPLVTWVAFAEVSPVRIHEAKLLALSRQTLRTDRPRILLHNLDTLRPMSDPLASGTKKSALLRLHELVALDAVVADLGKGLSGNGLVRRLVIVTSVRKNGELI